ncbi:MAG: carbon-nitrogen hydrolase family protein [Helicobacteraceae bacterium]|nr:carbon-nitrogen hydrolase family protein [Helicobacteraceae bacterium]
MTVAVLQLPAIGMSSSKLDYYLKIAQKKDVQLVLLGEYLLNPFFKELETLSISMIKEQSEHQIEVLKELANKYNLTIVAPVILVKKKEPYKSVARISPTSAAYYNQQLLINYAHWNEEKFYANEIAEIKSPLIFNIENTKFAIMNGFELHFDEMFKFIKEKNVDCILAPSVSTFDSAGRWQNLIKMRSFTNHCYILRANRIGEYIDGEYTWKFYGDSIMTSPFGDIVAHLGNTEELMIVDIDHESVKESRRFWGFKEAINKRS